MKPAIPYILISASLVTAVIFGIPLLRGLRTIYALSKLPTDEFVTPGIALPKFIGSLLLALLPVALYAASFAFDRSAAWSWLGKLGLFVQVSYVLLLAARHHLPAALRPLHPPHRLTTRSSERRLAGGLFLYSTLYFASLRR